MQFYLGKYKNYLYKINKDVKSYKIHKCVLEYEYNKKFLINVLRNLNEKNNIQIIKHLNTQRNFIGECNNKFKEIGILEYIIINTRFNYKKKIIKLMHYVKIDHEIWQFIFDILCNFMWCYKNNFILIKLIYKHDKNINLAGFKGKTLENINRASNFNNRCHNWFLELKPNIYDDFIIIASGFYEKIPFDPRLNTNIKKLL